MIKTRETIDRRNNLLFRKNKSERIVSTDHVIKPILFERTRTTCMLRFFIKQYFTELEENLVASQPINKQQSMVECFKALMLHVERSLNGKNRDRYMFFSKIAIK